MPEMNGEGRKGRKGRNPRTRRKDRSFRRCRGAAQTGGNWRKPDALSQPRFDSLFQGGVEGDEPFFCVVEHGAERGDKEPAEGLLVTQPAATLSLLDDEGVLAVENAGDQHATEPAQFAAGFGDANGGTKRHRLATRRPPLRPASRAATPVALLAGDE